MKIIILSLLLCVTAYSQASISLLKIDTLKFNDDSYNCFSLQKKDGNGFTSLFTDEGLLYQYYTWSELKTTIGKKVVVTHSWYDHRSTINLGQIIAVRRNAHGKNARIWLAVLYSNDSNTQDVICAEYPDSEFEITYEDGSPFGVLVK